MKLAGYRAGAGTIFVKPGWLHELPHGTLTRCMKPSKWLSQVQYARDERFFALKRFVVIVVILVADLIFISSSHLVLLLFKSFKDGNFGLMESGVEGLVELLFLLGFTQGRLAETSFVI